MATAKAEKSLTWIWILVLALGLTLSLVSSYFMIGNRDIAPDWDYVSVIHFLIRGVDGEAPNLLSGDLFQFRINEHQPYFPMLIWGLDHYWFHSYGLLPVILMQVFAIAIVAIATAWSRDKSSSIFPISTAVFICGCALYLSMLQWENLVWPNQILLYTSLLLSVLALSKAVPIAQMEWLGQVRHGLLCSLLAAGATFSFGWGLVVWPVLLLHGLLTRWSWRGLLAVALPGILTIAVYFSQHGGGPGAPLASLLNPFTILNFAALLLGSPVAVVAGINYPIGYLSGYLLLALFAFAAFRIYFQKQKVSERQMRSLLLCLFCLCVCLLTALGRNALAYRYMLIPTLFYIAMPGLFLRPENLIKRGGKSILLIYFAGTLGLASTSFLSDRALRSRQFMIREGSIAAAFNTDPIHRGLSPDRNKINAHVWPYFIEHHGHAEAIHFLTWIGGALPESAIPQAPVSLGSHCMGHLDSIEYRNGYADFLTVRGWARLGPHGDKEARWIIVTDSESQVVGIATTGIKRPDVKTHLSASWIDDLRTQTNRAGFTGLVKAQPGDELTFHVYDAGKCYPFAKRILSAPTS